MSRSFIKHFAFYSFLIGLLGSLGVIVYLYGDNYRSDRLYVHYVIHSAWESWRAPISDGYTDRLAYQIGETQTLFFSYKRKTSRYIFLYDIAGHVRDSLYIRPQFQQKAEDPAVNGYGFDPTTTYSIPPLEPGLYTWEKCIPFLVRGEKEAPITVLYPSNTIHAYNIMGGKSFYSMFSKASDSLSFLRPTFPAVSFMVKPMLSWLHKTEFPLRFICDTDMDQEGILDSTHLLVIIGHSEYWSGQARTHFDQYVDGGGNVLILSGNTMWWKVRYSSNQKQIICFKEGNDPIIEKKIQSGNWAEHLDQDPKSSIGVSFALGGYGRKYPVSKGGFTILDTNHVLFKGIPFDGAPFISVPSKEYDGQQLIFQGPHVFLDSSAHNFHRVKLLGYDWASHGYYQGSPSILLLQKSMDSGLILNFPSTDWCSPYGMGGRDGEKIMQITQTAMELLWDHRKTALLWE